MKLVKFLVCFCVFAFFASCTSMSDVKEDKPLAQAKSGLSFDSVDGGLLEVMNASDEDLVFFAGSIQRSHVLGGIRAGQTRTFDYTPFLTNQKGMFICRAVRLIDYNMNTRLNMCDDVYSHIVVYGDESKTSLKVPQIIGGSGTIYLSNNSEAFVCEVLLNSPTGEVLATLLPFSMNKRIDVQFDNMGRGHVLFARFVYYDATNHKVAYSSPIGPVRIQPAEQGDIGMPIEFFSTDKVIKSFTGVNIYDFSRIHIELEEN